MTADEGAAAWVRVTVDEMGPFVEAFRAAAGKRARWALRAGGQVQVYEGRVPPVRRWRRPDEPYLLLRPGATDGVHVLAEMALHLRAESGEFFLARRKWYEEHDLDVKRLGPGPLEMELETLADE